MSNEINAALIKERIEFALDIAKKNNVEAEVSASESIGLSASARMGDVETVEFNNDRSFSITVYKGTQKGAASTNDLHDEAIEKAIKAASSIAGFTGEDKYAGLPDKDLLAWEAKDLDLDHPWDIDSEKAIALAIECEDAARNYDAEISNSEGAAVNSHRGVVVLGNSHGFVQSYSGGRHSISCSVIAGQADAMQRDYAYTLNRISTQLNSAAEVGEEAARKAIKRLNPQAIKSQEVPILFSNEMARSLLGSLMSAINGRSIYHKASFLLDSVGEQLFPEWLNVVEQPHLKQAIGSSAFDGEGTATQDRSWIEGGKLQGYMLDSYSARQLGEKTTGNAGGTRNLELQASNMASFDDLLHEMQTGFYVTEMMGSGANTVTGDYSRGAAGYWVENGVIQHAVDEVTIAGNLRDMYKDIVAVGNDIDLRSSTRSGSVLISKMTLAGK